MNDANTTRRQIRGRQSVLCMIVKNESHVILRLESLRPLVDYVLVEDTGPTEGTQQIIRDYFRQMDMPGQVIEQP